MLSDSKPLEIRIAQVPSIPCPFGANTIVIIDQQGDRRFGKCVLAEQALREKETSLMGRLGGCIESFLDKNGCPKPGGYVGWEAVLPLKVMCKYGNGKYEPL